MSDFSATLEQAVNQQQKSPSPRETLSTLVEAEKYSRRHQPQYQFEQFIGTWQLCFINGTNKSRSQFANLLADGFYLPKFIPVTITYSLLPESLDNCQQGKVLNNVSVGLVKFAVTGPCKFVQKKNILAFDFTYLQTFILGGKVFAKNIRGGQSSDEEFFQQSLAQQAFFSYFLVTDSLIAARGRGGGLALWRKIDREK